MLRRHVSHLPHSAREQRGPAGELSLKESLGHIAYWDAFAVRFFRSRIDTAVFPVAPPRSFDERSREALRAVRPLPFGEVLARYLEATGVLVGFLVENWDQLTDQEKRDFRVPLKHRRHHRLVLEQFLGLDADPSDRGSPLELAQGA